MPIRLLRDIRTPNELAAARSDYAADHRDDDQVVHVEPLSHTSSRGTSRWPGEGAVELLARPLGFATPLERVRLEPTPLVVGGDEERRREATSSATCGRDCP